MVDVVVVVAYAVVAVSTLKSRVRTNLVTFCFIVILMINVISVYKTANGMQRYKEK